MDDDHDEEDQDPHGGCIEPHLRGDGELYDCEPMPAGRPPTHRQVHSRQLPRLRALAVLEALLAVRATPDRDDLEQTFKNVGLLPEHKAGQD